MIRPPTPEDYFAIGVVLVDAFNGAEEAEIVRKLRADGDALVELVAEQNDEIVGYCMFSRMASDGGFFAALGPLAVATDHQREGIGQEIVREGIARCREAGVRAMVVLGHPDYYPRFGFSAAATKMFKGPYDRPAFMALDLAPGGLAEGGVVRYAPAFDV